MSELDEIRKSVNGLQVEIAGLHPVVKEIHSHMPRITVALETLARIEERQFANTDEHKRIHYRIEDVEESCEKLAEVSARTSDRVDELWRAYVECREDHRVVSQSVLKPAAGGWWVRTREMIAGDAVRWATALVLSFLLWMVLYNLPDYPPVKAVFESKRGYDSGRNHKD